MKSFYLGLTPGQQIIRVRDFVYLNDYGDMATRPVSMSMRISHDWLNSQAR